MTLRRKMTFQTGAMIAGLLLACGAALWGVNGLRGDLGLAASGYRELREVYEVAAHVSTARALMSVDSPAAAAVEIDRAAARLDLAVSHESEGSALLRSPDGARLAAAFGESIREARTLLRLPADDAFHSGPAAAREAVNRAFGQAAAIALSIRGAINLHEQAADRRWRQTIRLVAAVSAAAILLSITLGVLQYRGVISPLRRFADAARTIAAGRFTDRVAPGGAAEFGDLARDFNRMAGELEALYRELEQKVAAKSRELVRSERLASVGFLAAGVAHEINNPLGVITGYGERAMRELDRGGDPAGLVRHLRVICEEAYRCKAITDKLLSLARPGDEDRGTVLLNRVAADTVELMRGLPAWQGRRIILGDADDVPVVGSAGELKQVALNLLLNAMEAVDPQVGEVRVEVDSDGGTARLTVTDNGRGMSAATLERVFEPFFTEKRGGPSAGTGLGLSISHAIVQSHGGRMLAASDGPGRGSRFTVELPAMTANVPP